MLLNRSFRTVALSAFLVLVPVIATGLTTKVSAEDIPDNRYPNQIHGTLTNHTDLSEIAPLIQQLDSDSYVARKQAAKRLVNLAHSSNMTAQVRAALLELSETGSIEQRAASRRLVIEIDQQISRLNPIPRSFSEAAGNDQSAEQLYRRMKDRFGRWIAMAQSKQLLPQAWHESFSLSKLSPDDHEAWATVLYMEILLNDVRTEEADQAATPSSLYQAVLTRHAKIRTILSHPAMGPTFSDHSLTFGDQPVLGRLIESYLRLGHLPADRSLVLAARRYGRVQFLVEQSQRWIDCDEVSAASRVTAMLALLAVDPERLDGHLSRLAQDDRVAHVWQSVESGPEKIETRVSDVAQVISLHRRGLDPREHGFEFLRADPWLVYAPYSLGSVKRIGRISK